MTSLFDCTVAGVDCRIEYRDPGVPPRCDGYDVRAVTAAATPVRVRFEGGRVADLIRRHPGTVPLIAEWTCIYDQVSRQMLRFDRLTFHGACVEFGGKAYVFTAYHGTGKSTHIRLWRRYLGDAVRVVNGDKPIISVADGILACGTPWCGKEGWQNNVQVPLAAICILRRAEGGVHSTIRQATTEESLDELVNRIYLTNDPAQATKAMDMLNAILKAVPVYVLTCDMSEDAVRTSFEGLTGELYESWKA